MRIILTLALCAFATACVHKGEKFKDGDTWVVRSTFVMKCKINADGSWFTKVIGCKTLGGVVVEPGRVVSEGATTYECSTMKDGRVEIKRTYQNNKRQTSCEGHNIGESWVTQHNFRKMCTEDGARITECLTDAGISVPLNQNLVLSGIVYTCTRYPNGTVSINREGLPAPTNFKNNLRPVEVLGPMWKKFQGLGRLLQSEVEPDRKATMVAPSVVRSEHKGVKDQPAITCVSKGKVYHPEETRISAIATKQKEECTSR
ncbi:hypothetical protein ANCCEY_08958 [Ancylostoma ceylanicum]|uniref:Abnormal cell migration protein 18-like fibronectin type I domain-containing protein n=1 Tax=Ancylostoma ceylanicum TaxID=53326 RepID=A0A0D6LPK0_9BILA|nr:hypothetical protein ANCCEY_08958 [Ancylostoma ceylanicum]